MKISEEINKIVIPPKIKLLLKIKPSKSKHKWVPLSIKVLFPEMKYSTYLYKINDPKFLYDNLKLWNDCFQFVKHIQTWKDIGQMNPCDEKLQSINELNNPSLCNSNKYNFLLCRYTRI